MSYKIYADGTVEVAGLTEGSSPKRGELWIDRKSGAEHEVAGSTVIVVSKTGKPQPFETVFVRPSPAERVKQAIADQARALQQRQVDEQRQVDNVREQLGLGNRPCDSALNSAAAAKVREELELDAGTRSSAAGADDGTNVRNELQL